MKRWDFSETKGGLYVHGALQHQHSLSFTIRTVYAEFDNSIITNYKLYLR